MADMFDNLSHGYPGGNAQWQGGGAFDGLLPEQGGWQPTYEERLAILAEEERQRRLQQESGYGRQIFSGLVEGATTALGAPVDLMNNFVVAPALMGINAVFGTDLKPSAEPLGGSAGLRRGLAISPETDEAGPRIARRIAQSIGGAAVPLSASVRTVGELAAGLGTAAVGGAGGATAQYYYPDNIGVELAAELAASGLSAAAVNSVLKQSARRAAADATPTVAELRKMASDRYTAAQNAGAFASAADTTGLADRVGTLGLEKGWITPTGRVVATNPRVAESVGLLNDYAGQSMKPLQMRSVRETLDNVRSATEGSDREIASGILDKFDAFTDPLGPELVGARELAERVSKANQLETMRKTAVSNVGGKRSGPDFDGALKAEYQKKLDDIGHGQAPEWAPEQLEAIRRAAYGTNMSRALAHVGELGPTGPLSFVASVGTPLGVGALLGRQDLGAAAGFGASMLGYGSRALAAKMGRDYANQAELLVRRGGVTPARPASHDAVRQRLIEAIVGGTIGGLN